MTEPREVKARREEGWRRMFDAELTQQEHALQIKLRRFFIKQNAELTQVFTRGTKSRGDWFDEFARRAGTLDPIADAEALRATINDALGGMIDWKKQSANIDNLLRPARAQALATGMEAARKAYGIQAVRGPELSRGILDAGFAKLAHSDEITETTRGLLARSFADGIAAGEGRSALIARVQEYMPKISEGRAAVIASTEAHAAISMGNYQQMVDAGFTSKKWKATLDGSTRDAHVAINGDDIPIEQRFSNGLMYPGDPSTNAPGQIINCRCVLIPGNKVRKPTEQRPSAMLTSGSKYSPDDITSAKVNIELDTYDSDDQNAIDKMLAKYENGIVSENIEHAYVLSAGKVYHAIGHDNNVNFAKVMELGPTSLEGAIVIHNHPAASSAPNLSDTDISSAIEHKLKMIVGCDPNYRFWVKDLHKAELPDGYSFSMVWKEQYAKAFDKVLQGSIEPEELVYETTVRSCKEVGIVYERRRRP